MAYLSYWVLSSVMSDIYCILSEPQKGSFLAMEMRSSFEMTRWPFLVQTFMEGEGPHIFQIENRKAFVSLFMRTIVITWAPSSSPNIKHFPLLFSHCIISSLFHTHWTYSVLKSTGKSVWKACFRNEIVLVSPFQTLSVKSFLSKSSTLIRNPGSIAALI